MFGADPSAQPLTFQGAKCIRQGALHTEATLAEHQRLAWTHQDRQHIHRGAANELGHKQIGRPSVELHGCAQLLQPPLVQHRDPVPHGHRLHLIVGHIERGGAQLALQFHDLFARGAAQFGVEIAEGLIHQKHRRLPGHGPAQGHPLLLPA